MGWKVTAPSNLSFKSTLFMSLTWSLIPEFICDNKQRILWQIVCTDGAWLVVIMKDDCLLSADAAEGYWTSWINYLYHYSKFCYPEYFCSNGVNASTQYVKCKEKWSKISYTISVYQNCNADSKLLHMHNVKWEYLIMLHLSRKRFEIRSRFHLNWY